MYTIALISYTVSLLPLMQLLLLSLHVRTVSPAANVIGVQGLHGADESSFFTFIPDVILSSLAAGDGSQFTGGESVQRDAHVTCLVDLMVWCDVTIHPSSGFVILEKIDGVPRVIVGGMGGGYPPVTSPSGCEIGGIKGRFILLLLLLLLMCTVFSLFLLVRLFFLFLFVICFFGF